MRWHARASRPPTKAAEAVQEKGFPPGEDPQDALVVDPSSVRSAFWSFVVALLFWGTVFWFFFEPGAP